MVRTIGCFSTIKKSISDNIRSNGQSSGARHIYGNASDVPGAPFTRPGPAGAPVVIAGVLRPLLANPIFVKKVRVVNLNICLTIKENIA